MYQGELYRKSWDGSLLTCVSTEDVPKLLKEIHEGWCKSHIGARSLGIKKVVGPSTYELEHLDGNVVNRTWHASKLSNYYV
ncbi:hypothetical protein LIER_32592 [Lithospermum erythrorhizon]|uniref:Polyprotein n=1 Tax=Lithospermum erythrorhizon TaxID=34254 RepID=A0AAV3RV77_LITER